MVSELVGVTYSSSPPLFLFRLLPLRPKNRAHPASPPDKKHVYTSYTLLKEPAPKMANSAKVPVVLVMGEVSYHAPYDHCMIRFLKQIGVEKARCLDLGRRGFEGNGYFRVLERNSAEFMKLIGGGN